MEYDLTLFEKGLEELGIALSQDQKSSLSPIMSTLWRKIR